MAKIFTTNNITFILGIAGLFLFWIILQNKVIPNYREFADHWVRAIAWSFACIWSFIFAACAFFSLLADIELKGPRSIT